MIATNIRIEGNSIFIKSDPVIGILTLTSFADDASGESGPITFTKYFRYTLNGVEYTDFIPLTTPAITSIPVQSTDTLVIEVQYVKNQPTGTDVLEVSEFAIDTTNAPDPVLPYFDNTVFKQFFGSNDVEVLKWYVAVLDKLYQRGLIPNYIDRLNDFDSSEDFIDFWASIAKFFAYLVTYARKFQKFYQSEVLLAEFLEERGLNVSPEDTLNQMNYMMSNFYKEIFHRGTMHIVDKVENGDIIDGELLRLIFYKREEDEVLFNPYKKEHFGWNLGNSSPLNKSMYLNDNVNKSYETTFDIFNLAKYPIVGTTAIQVDGPKSTMFVNNGGIGAAGGYKPIKVDPRLDYEFSFMIKKAQGEDLTVGVTAYDKDGNVIDLKSYKDGSISNTFLSNVSLSRDDKYVLVRLFIYNKNRTTYINDSTEIHQGNDLIFNEDTVYIIPTIHVSGTANIWGIRILPMQTSYSRGFLQVNNFISAWLRNRNQNYTLNEIKDYIRKYLIPYNAHIEVSDVGDAGYNAIETPPDTFYWVPAGEYCERLGWRPIAPSCVIVNYGWVPEEETAYCETEENVPNPTT